MVWDHYKNIWQHFTLYTCCIKNIDDSRIRHLYKNKELKKISLHKSEIGMLYIKIVNNCDSVPQISKMSFNLKTWERKKKCTLIIK